MFDFVELSWLDEMALMYVGSDSIKKKINISKEFVNKIRGTVSFLRCSNNYTSLRGEQQATISYNRMRCDKY